MRGRAVGLLSPNSEVARLCEKKPLTRLATLATLSLRRGLKTFVVDGPLPRGEGGLLPARSSAGAGRVRGNFRRT
ncbi:hypothetical protein SBA2_430002 [Acidobacteriia bacterium SbA2]|nr:hypothetical protein SBA2_430002 [Acidobacteriia bacterium SbA2]